MAHKSKEKDSPGKFLIWSALYPYTLQSWQIGVFQLYTLVVEPFVYRHYHVCFSMHIFEVFLAFTVTSCAKDTLIQLLWTLNWDNQCESVKDWGLLELNTCVFPFEWFRLLATLFLLSKLHLRTSFNYYVFIAWSIVWKRIQICLKYI